MIRKERVAKVYAGMAPQELAALAFQYTVANDDTNADLVTEAVPWKLYKCPSWEFTSRYDCIFKAASFWSIQYLKAQTCLLASLARASRAIHAEDYLAAEGYHDSLDAAHRRVTALVRAMETVAAEVGVDPGAFWHVVGLDPVPEAYHDDHGPDPDWLVDMTEMLRGIATGARGDDVRDKLLTSKPH